MSAHKVPVCPLQTACLTDLNVERFLNFCAQGIGHMVNAASVAVFCGVGRQAVRQPRALWCRRDAVRKGYTDRNLHDLMGSKEVLHHLKTGLMYRCPDLPGCSSGARRSRRSQGASLSALVFPVSQCACLCGLFVLTKNNFSQMESKKDIAMIQLFADAMGKWITSYLKNEARIAGGPVAVQTISDRTRIQETLNQYQINLRQLIDPFLSRLEAGKLSVRQRRLVEMIRMNVDEVFGSALSGISSAFLLFSPNELQVANLIRNGKTNKEIAQALNISPRTVESHRANIRSKLGLKNKKVNLKNYLCTQG